MKNIAIIVTTFLRDDLLRTTVDSMLAHAPKNCQIFIGDQGCRNPKDHLAKINEYYKERVYYYPLPFDCGLSHARNYLVEQALKMGYEYCLIASDSMIFNENTRGINDILPYLESGEFDAIGLCLNNAEIYWVGWLKLIEHQNFELDFIDRSKDPDVGPIYRCGIIHNFFIAKTSSLAQVKWDENLKLCEHEDFFYRYGQAGFKVGWTKVVSCDRIKTRDGAHGMYRNNNWVNGLQELKLKWGLRGWIGYVNRNLGFYGGTKYPCP